MSKVLITTASFGSDIKSEWAEQKSTKHITTFRRYDDRNFPFRNYSLTMPTKSKLIKMLSHEFNPGYDYYIWVDSNITINSQFFTDKMVDSISNADLCLFKHSRRNNIKEEVDKLLYWVSKGSARHIKRINGEDITGQHATYLSNPMFIDDKLFFGACFIYSKKLVEKENNMMKAWFYHVCRYSIRDMLSLPYVLKNYDVNYNTFNFSFSPNKLFKIVASHTIN